jgi:hypothetical protein
MKKKTEFSRQAVLSVDSSFFRDMKAVKLNSQEPFLQDEVYVAGFPEGV